MSTKRLLLAASSVALLTWILFSASSSSGTHDQIGWASAARAPGNTAVSSFPLVPVLADDPTDSRLPDPSVDGDSGSAALSSPASPDLVYADFSTGQLVSLDAELRFQLNELKTPALNAQWTNGLVHPVEGYIHEDGGRRYRFTGTEFNKQLRMIRMRHDGSSSICEEVRLERSQYPEIYAVKDTLDLVQAELQKRGVHQSLPMDFSSLGPGFQSVNVGY
jgi:hypothetical protein